MSVAAFFDIDGTLIGPPSLERQFRGYLAWRGEIGMVHRMLWLRRFLAGVWREPLRATHGNKAVYARARLAALNSWVPLLSRHALRFYPAAVAQAAWHAAAGHCIFLVSGTLEPLAAAIAEALQALVAPAQRVEVIATRLEVHQRRLTGRVAGPPVCGREKACAVLGLAAERALDLSASFAYGNTLLDRWMLECVGHPVAVNPSLLLGIYARRRGWPILLWRDSTLPFSARASLPWGEHGEEGIPAAGLKTTGGTR
jgi:HAD superfamily hydrolase (TIGR01490 family)